MAPRPQITDRERARAALEAAEQVRATLERDRRRPQPRRR
jgi:hypothetical protein